MDYIVEELERGEVMVTGICETEQEAQELFDEVIDEFILQRNYGDETPHSVRIIGPDGTIEKEWDMSRLVKTKFTASLDFDVYTLDKAEAYEMAENVFAVLRDLGATTFELTKR